MPLMESEHPSAPINKTAIDFVDVVCFHSQLFVTAPSGPEVEILSNDPWQFEAHWTTEYWEHSEGEEGVEMTKVPATCAVSV